ncbi:hypothetical protein ASC61_09155 [Aeromicrobium sp. Root344]|uniref:hypothetical protein n=1 Tax=Aeromicrobium sp. Root344 TaxID=1736521 RepID=UPI00070077CC|nr:hypothetical protein [Aeromicrobium sp. Root344]KQV75156.1 hypothetical protein ASC61_09155 [Aeromicrobium sp. Root344]
MNDEQKTPEDEQSTTEQATVEQPTPAPAAAPEASTRQDTKTPVFSSPRTRNILLTSGAGLALAGGVLGFGIGHATAGGDDGRDDRMSRFAPGDGRPDFRDRNHEYGQRGGGPGQGPASGNQPDNRSGDQPNGDNDPA